MRDFLIVGGGVIGLSIAWELARSGKQVCVVDRQQPGRSTSWVGAGIFPPPQLGAQHDPLERLRSISHDLHVEWSERLLAETGVDNELRKCGGIYVARRAGEAAALRVSMQQHADDGVEVIEWSSDDVVAHEPNLAQLAQQIKVAFWLPEEMQIRSPLHLQALLLACRQLGVEILPDVEVHRVETLGEQVTGLQSSAGKLTASEYVFCGGPWAPELMESLDILLPVEPWRGQLILWKTDPSLLSSVLNEGFRYLVPREDGHLLAGATVEDVGFDCQTTDEAISELKEYSCSLLPQLRDYEVTQAWAGLRPKTPDGVPFMGRVPGFDNLSLATGHYRSGLHLSPVTAVFMRQLLLQDTTDLEAMAFRMNR